MRVVGFLTEDLGGPGDPQTVEIKDIKGSEEQVVGVSHGAWAQEDVARRIDFIRNNLWALLIVQSSDPANSKSVEHLRDWLPEGRRKRVFGLTKAWNNLQPEEWQRILAFLTSENDLPPDLDVQTLLGLDAPVLRLALRVALEVVRHEITPTLQEDASKQNEQADVALADFLQPAIELAGAVPGQEDTAKSLTEFLVDYSLKSLTEFLADRKAHSVLEEIVDDALGCLAAEVKAQTAEATAQT